MIINPEDFGDSLTSLPQKHLLNVSLGADTAVMNINHVMPNSHWFQIVKCDAEFCFLNTFELWIVGAPDVDRSSCDRKVVGLIPDPCSLHVEASLCKTYSH